MTDRPDSWVNPPTYSLLEWNSGKWVWHKTEERGFGWCRCNWSSSGSSEGTWGKWWCLQMIGMCHHKETPSSSVSTWKDERIYFSECALNSIRTSMMVRIIVFVHLWCLELHLCIYDAQNCIRASMMVRIVFVHLWSLELYSYIYDP